MSTANFTRANMQALDILLNNRGKIVSVHKTTRAGATTSLIINACELGQKTVIIAPTLKILDETVLNAVSKAQCPKTPVYLKLPQNKELCKRLVEKCQTTPALKKLPVLYRPSCKGCIYNDPKQCKLQAILQSDYDVLGLTYQKLERLAYGEGAIAKMLFEAVKSPDNIILDEFTSGIVASFPQETVVQPRTALKQDFPEFEAPNISMKTPDTILEFWSSLLLFASECERRGNALQNDEEKIFNNPIKRLISRAQLGNLRMSSGQFWKIIEDFTIQGRNTDTLQKLVCMFTAEKFEISKNSKGEVKVKSLRMPLDEDTKIISTEYLRTLVKVTKPETLVALVDASQPKFNVADALGVYTIKKVTTRDPLTGFFHTKKKKVIDSDRIVNVKWGDPLGTAKTQLIVCDRRQISVREFYRTNGNTAQPFVKESINAVCALHGASNVIVATLNSKMAKETLYAWRKNGEIPSDISLTWYRSTVSKGTSLAPNIRYMVLIGAPYVPVKAFKAETCSSGYQKAAKHSDEAQNFVNMVGRVKDPNGRERSVVYALGVTAFEAENWLRQPVNAPYIGQFPMQGTVPEDFKITGELFIDRVNVDDINNEIPFLAMVIRKVREKKKVAAWEVVPNGTKSIKKLVTKYKPVLKSQGIEVEDKPNGYTLIDTGKRPSKKGSTPLPLTPPSQPTQTQTAQALTKPQQNEDDIVWFCLAVFAKVPPTANCDRCIPGQEKPVTHVLEYNQYISPAKYFCFKHFMEERECHPNLVWKPKV